MYTLRGAYQTPEESRKFTTSVLTLQAPPTPLQKLKIEVSMQFEFSEWKVSMIVFEKEREDEEHGNITKNKTVSSELSIVNFGLDLFDRRLIFS